MRKSTCLLPKVLIALTLGLVLVATSQHRAFAQGDVIPSSTGSGGFFNRQLGTALRFNYHTQGYGTQDDVFSLGGMKVFNMEGAAAFLDGQGTLSDDFGGGFNLGAGYRQLTTLGTSFDPERIMGASFWTDGQSSANDNFFTQLGFSLESLGDAYDVRFSGYFPLTRSKTGDATLTGSGTPFYSGNNIFGATESFGVDTALDVLDGELAVRISDLEAWAFAGAYYVGGGDDDTAGYRAGARGYALPDLAVSLSVTDDDIYSTNVMFGMTWFIGRTHKGNAPTGSLLDRFREPVLRNDFIAMETSRVTRESGAALTSPDDNEAIRVVHIDSNDGTNVAGGGDGSFENPFADLSDVDAITNGGSSMEGDIILVHSTSTLTGTATLQADQMLLGEGIDQDMNEIPHLITTNEMGNINLPETADGSQLLARPTMTNAGIPVTLANNNTVNNFTINGASTAIFGDTVTTPTLQNLQINDSATGIDLRTISGLAVVENTVQINRASVAAITIDDGSDAMAIGADINATTGQSLAIQNRGGGTIDFTGTIDDTEDEDGNPVATNSTGVLIANNNDSTINMTNTNNIRVAGTDTGITITGNATTAVNATGLVDIAATGDANGLVVMNTDTASSVDFADLNASAVDGNTVDVQNAGSVEIASASSTNADPRGISNTGTGNAFFNVGHASDADRNATIVVDSDITNAGGGQAVNINTRSANDITFGGTIDVADGASGGVLVQDAVDGNIVFTNTLTLNTGTSNAVELLNNADGVGGTMATLSFTDLDIDTTTGNGFTATGGGNLIVTSTNGTNTIDVNGAGIALNLEGMTIDTADVVFDEVNSTGGAQGIILRDLEGDGQVLIGGGTTAGDGGTLATTGTAITVDNVGNVAFTNMTIDNDSAPNTGAGVLVTNQVADSTASFNTLTVLGTTATGVDVNNNQDGTILFTDLEVTTTSGTAISVVNNNDATTTINNMDVTTTSGVGFNAAGTGTLVATRAGTNTNDIATDSGQAISLLNTEIGAAGFTVDTVNVAAGTGTSIGLTNVTGGAVTLGSGTDPGDGGTITTTAATDAIAVDNVEDLTINNITVVNNGGGGGLSVTNQTAGSSATFNNMDATAGAGNAVDVNGNDEGVIAFNDLTATAAAGDGVSVGANTFANVTFNGVTSTAAAGNAVDVSSNTDGNIVMNDLEATTTGTGTVVRADTNAAATLSINNMTVEATGAGAGFSATGNGNLAITGTTSIDTTTGKVLEIVGQDISAASNIDTVNSTGAVEGIAIELRDITGSTLTVGSGTNPGDGGTISNEDNVGADEDHAILVDNVANLDMNNITVANAGTNGRAIEVRNNTGGSRTFDGMTTTTGLLAGGHVSVHDNSGGTTTFNDLTADSSAGGAHAIHIADNTGGTINVASATVTSAAGDGFRIENNTGATVTASDFEVATTSGTGFNATGGGNLTTSGSNTIETTTGVGLNLDGMNIATSAVFDSVDVSNGATNGIVLNNLTGSQVRVGLAAATGTDGTGGTLNTAGTSILVSGVTNAVFNDVTTSTTGAFNGASVTHTTAANATVVFNNLTHSTTGTGDAVVLTDNGTGEIDFTLQNSNIDVQAADSIGFNLITGNNGGEIDVRLNNNVILAGDNNAVLADLTAGTGDVQFLVNGGNDWTNDSAGSSTVDFIVNTDRTLNATIGDRIGVAPFDENRFNNLDVGGTAVSLTSNSAAASLNLDLRGNTAAGGANNFLLTETLGDFGVVDRTATITADANNTGTVDIGGGGVEADFGDPAVIKQVD